MLFRKLRLKNWHPLKQTKTKNKRHFFIPTFKVIQLCFFDQNDSFTLKVLKCNLSLAEPWYETLHIQSAIFLFMAQPKINCVFRTFRVKESFWAKKQSCITLKFGIKKWCLVFVCFSGCHFTLDGFIKFFFHVSTCLYHMFTHYMQNSEICNAFIISEPEFTVCLV